MVYLIHEFNTGELNTMVLNDKIVEKTKIKENETK